MNQIISQEARRAIMIGRKNHWRFRAVTKTSEWVYEDVEAPQVGLDRIEALRRSGVPIKGFVIAHEAPKLLPAPKPEPKQDFKVTSSIPDISGDILVLLFLPLVFLDPALLVELEDGSLIEVLTWLD